MPGRIRMNPGPLVVFLPDADPDALAETIIAFANADGGTLYVGVSEDGEPTGLVYPEDFEDTVQQAQVRCRPPVPVVWDQTEARGAFAFVMQVYRSPDLHMLDDGNVFIRAGNENRLLTGLEIQQIAATRSTGDYEAEAVPGSSRDDLDGEVLREFIEVWQERQKIPLTRPLDDVMLEMGWLLPSGQPTVAGILLFGKNPMSFIPHCGITFVRFDGTQPRMPQGEAGYGRRVEVNGPLARVIERTWDIIQEEIGTGAVVRGLKREEKWMYPPRAIREALVNAVAHRDYRIHGRSVEIRMYTDRLEISSPGGLPGFITLDNIVEEHYSRNPRLVSGLYQWRFIEELGLGVDLMIEEMLKEGHPPPEFRPLEHGFTVIFRNVRTRQPSYTPPDGSTMNERQMKVVAYLQQHQRIRNREYQELCPDVHPETLRLDLVEMVEHGILLKIGEKRGTYYILK